MCYVHVHVYLFCIRDNVRGSPSVENEVRSENLLSCQCVSHWPHAICRPRRYLVLPRSPNNLLRLSAASNPLAAIIPIAHAEKEREGDRGSSRCIAFDCDRSAMAFPLLSHRASTQFLPVLCQIFGITTRAIPPHCRARLEYSRNPAVRSHRDGRDSVCWPGACRAVRSFVLARFTASGNSPYRGYSRCIRRVNVAGGGPHLVARVRKLCSLSGRLRMTVIFLSLWSMIREGTLYGAHPAVCALFTFPLACYDDKSYRAHSLGRNFSLFSAQWEDEKRRIYVIYIPARSASVFHVLPSFISEHLRLIAVGWWISVARRTHSKIFKSSDSNCSCIPRVTCLILFPLCRKRLRM